MNVSKSGYVVDLPTQRRIMDVFFLISAHSLKLLLNSSRACSAKKQETFLGATFASFKINLL